MLFIILTTNDPHFSRETNCLWQTLSCAALSWAVTPSCQPCPISFRSLETCSSQLSVCLRNSHLLPPSGPSPCAWLCSLLVRHFLPGASSALPPSSCHLPVPTAHGPCPLSLSTPSFSLSPGRPAVSFHCVTLGKFLNLSRPVFSLVKCIFSLTEQLFVCWALHLTQVLERCMDVGPALEPQFRKSS